MVNFVLTLDFCALFLAVEKGYKIALIYPLRMAETGAKGLGCTFLTIKPFIPCLETYNINERYKMSAPKDVVEDFAPYLKNNDKDWEDAGLVKDAPESAKKAYRKWKKSRKPDKNGTIIRY